MLDKNLQICKIKAVFFDFDGVFTDNLVLTDQFENEYVRCCRSDGLGLKRLNELNVKNIIISTEKNPVVKARAKKLGIECIQGVEDKSEVINNYCNENNLSLDLVAFVGNDINDISALKIVGFPIAVSDAYEEILPFVKFITIKKGGNGAVREICDLIFNSHKKHKRN
jgi:3-deoxy-D-manno-octulosonate 8-phosphate phosphatase (KDO 8-P phosphatase)